MKLLFFTPACRIEQSLLMDRAYEGDKMRAVAKKLGYNPVVPPKKNRIDPWEYDRILYKRRNEVERFFRRIKRFRRVFTRYDKLDIVFAGFILFAMIFDSLVGTGSNINHVCGLYGKMDGGERCEKSVAVGTWVASISYYNRALLEI